MDDNPYQLPMMHEPDDELPADSPNGAARPGGMTAPEIFGIVVRAIGLYLLVVALINLTSFCFPRPFVDEHWSYLRFAVAYALLGAILFFYPNLIVRIAYRRRDS